MVEGDDLDEVGRHVPFFPEHAADFGVRNTQNVLLGFDEGPVAGGRLVESLSKLLWGDPEIHHYAEVMEEAGEIGFFGIAESDGSGEITAGQSNAHGVLPEHRWIHGAISGSEVDQAARSDNVLHAAHAEVQDSLANGFDGAAQAKQGRVGKVQALGGQRFILGNEASHLADLERIDGLPQILEQRANHGGQAGQAVRLLQFFEHQIAIESGHGFAFPAG